MTLPAAQILRRTPLFATLTDEDLRRVAAIAVSRKYARKETIFREGDRADGFFVVEAGKVKVFKLSEEGKEQVLHVLEPGQSFAEAAIFQGGSYPAHAEALADSELLLLPKPAFIDLLERNPRLAVRMLASLSRWLRRMTDLVEKDDAASGPKSSSSAWSQSALWPYSSPPSPHRNREALPMCRFRRPMPVRRVSAFKQAPHWPPSFISRSNWPSRSAAGSSRIGLWLLWRQ